MLCWLRSVAARLSFAVLALLLGLVAPLHAGGPSPSVTDEHPTIQAPAVAPLVVQVFLIAYRSQGPPEVNGSESRSIAAMEGQSGSTWRYFVVVWQGDPHSARVIKGRFVNRDPMGYVDGSNLYSGYFAPNGLDPSGLITDEEIAQVKQQLVSVYGNEGRGLLDYYERQGGQFVSGNYWFGTTGNEGYNRIGLDDRAAANPYLAGNALYHQLAAYYEQEHVQSKIADSFYNPTTGQVEGYSTYALFSKFGVQGMANGWTGYDPRKFAVDPCSFGQLSTGERWSQGAWGTLNAGLLALPATGLAGKMGGRVVSEGAEDMVTLYRGTNLGSELGIYQESGAILSDAGRAAYLSARGEGLSIQEALGAARSASESAHAQQLTAWGNLNDYAQAHGAFGQEITVFGPRSMVSFTTDPAVAARFGDTIFTIQVPKSAVIPQTLTGAGESEQLLIHGWHP